MASVKGFELKEIKKFQGDDGNHWQQVSLYHHYTKVGVITEFQSGLPSIRIEANYHEQWYEAILYFKRNFYDSLDIATGEELYYFLLTLSEWERIFKRQFSEGATLLVVLEEMDKKDGHRTGVYKVYSAKNGQEHQAFIEDAKRFETENQAVWWRKLTFTSLEELNFK